MSTVLFTSESVSEGHPDKVADRISDAILDAVLRVDPNARVAAEVLVTKDFVVLAGEITGPELGWATIARKAIRDIGYGDVDFDADKVHVDVRIQRQSLEIAAGVDSGGAGDQGLMFGYACRETDALMPAAIHYSHAIVRKLSELRKAGDKRLGPDAKSQITIEYDEEKNPVRAHTVVVSQMHDAAFSKDELTKLVRSVVESVLPAGWFDAQTRFLVNPAGTFVRGGPAIDTGLTGRKIIVDTYGGSAPHGGGAFSGKDPTKVDRSGAYAARWLAKNVVAAKLASRCGVQIAYAIGEAEPVSLLVDTFGTSRHRDEEIVQAIKATVDLTPNGLRERLQLNRPIYERTAAYGHFGREPDADGGFSWEREDGESLVRALEFNPLYRRTTYVAHHGDTTFEVRIDAEHPELDAALRTSGANEWAYITAWNPHSDRAFADVNEREQQRLEQELAKRGVTFFRGQSRPDDSSAGEESVLAFISHAEAQSLGKDFRQNAIVVGRVGGCAKLVWLR